MGGLWSAWLFWFFEALVCVSGKTKCAKCVGKKFPFLCVGYFLFFSVSDCCLVRCRSVGSGSRPVIATNGCGFAKLGPFHRSLQKLITTKIINNYIRWAQAPISSKPMLCTVDVPWFLRMEGQRSCRSPSFSLHHVCQKSKPQLATKHGFFNGIDCAYIACRRPSIPCFSEA